ncbi:MAG: HAMP domain-containing histidine kinase [Firmicutes bacterium]|nr:HAMP domain-containing histidine kinase [Bacillota bacterium]
MNEDLIKEIKKRYDSEVRSIKEKLRYEREREKLNEKIKYEEIRAQFFANISHEFKTPLNVIFSAQQMIDLLIKNDLKDNEEKINKYVKTIKQNCYRLIRLIGNLIDITKIDTGVYEFKPINIDIVRVVKDITFSVIDYIENKNISLNFNSTINEKTIACDPDKIERILLNLISNAIKFTPENGKIDINLSDSKDSVYISIKDSGIGIPKGMQKIIFDRFVQVDKTTKRAREGSGIGLSLVKALVEMHSGEIKLISEKNNGSEFIIRLPSKIINTEKIKDEIAATSQEKVEKINVEFSDIYF